MPTQKNRLLAIHIVGQSGEPLVLRRFSINDQMGRLFRMEVEMDSEDIGISFEDIVGKNATVQLTMPNEENRCFNGIVTRFEQEQQGRVARYRATISPKLWRLTRTADCKIFQAKTAPEIIKEVFDAHGMVSGEDYKMALTGSYIKRDFCVQYRETAFNFVSRLMEQDGIFYFFKHDDSGKDVMVLADSNSAFDPFPGYDDLTYRPAAGKHEEQRESVTDWIVEKEIQTGKYAMTDYNFEKPALSLLAKDNTAGTKGGDLEVFDYSGGYETPSDGDAYAKLRVEELQAQYEIIRAKTTARGVATGCTFTLKEHPRSDQEREYLVTSMSLEARSGAYASGGEEEDEGEFFSCNFSAIPIKTSNSMPFRMPRTTPRPMIRGPQTAIVVGPSGEEIYTDAHARVKLHFHWDRYDSKDDKSSCWVRVSQNWASAAWGSMHLPRINDEVIVEFLEGDPDRPIVTGRVYHGTNVPPYTLPDEKTKSTIKSNSSKGGGGFNEFRFEDKKGSEEVYLHAQKDQTIKVENDENTEIGNNRTETVQKDESITINGGRTETVAKDESITINGGRTETVAKDESITINGGRTETVAKDESITINGGRTEQVAKDENIVINGGRTESVDKNENITITGKRTESVGEDESVTVTGQRTVSIGKDDGLQVQNNLSIQAGDSITITTGSASITMKSDGTIQINGQNITTNGSGDIGVQASGNLTLKGTKIAAN